eukprot:527361-Prymnesium_polylepis.1
MTSTVAGLPALTPALATRLSSGHRYSVSPRPQTAISTFGLLDNRTARLAGGIKNGFLGAGSVISSMADMCKWMRYLMSSNSSAVSESQSGQMVVPLQWAQIFMSLDEAPVGNAFAAGFGFDVAGTLFRGSRFFEKGGDSLLHQTRSGFLPEQGVAVFVAANMEGSPMQGQYVNGIRNALLDIFTGADEQTVEANWAPLDAKGGCCSIRRAHRATLLLSPKCFPSCSTFDSRSDRRAAERDAQLPPARRVQPHCDAQVQSGPRVLLSEAAARGVLECGRMLRTAAAEADDPLHRHLLRWLLRHAARAPDACRRPEAAIWERELHHLPPIRQVRQRHGAHLRAQPGALARGRPHAGRLRRRRRQSLLLRRHLRPAGWRGQASLTSRCARRNAGSSTEQSGGACPSLLDVGGVLGALALSAVYSVCMNEIRQMID